MTHILIERGDETLHINEATVADIIGLLEHRHSQARADLLADLEEISATEEAKLEALAKLREDKGMTSALVRSCFTLSGAVDVIKYVVPPEQHERVLDAEPDDVVLLALRVLGFEVDDETTTQDAGDARPTNGRATSIETL